MFRLTLPIVFFLAISCQSKPEEAQHHHNQIMVAQHRIVSAFDQLDSSLHDSTGYRLLYWEYDSVAWHLQQMQHLLDTIPTLKGDSSLIHAARMFYTSLNELHQHEYPVFLDAYRKYMALGKGEDSIQMIVMRERIEKEKAKSISVLKECQIDFVTKYNLIVLDSIN